MGQSVSESDLGHGTRNYRQATPLHLSLLTIGLRCHPKQAPLSGPLSREEGQMGRNDEGTRVADIVGESGQRWAH
jgi:hypothetical protein